MKALGRYRPVAAGAGFLTRQAAMLDRTAGFGQKETFNEYQILTLNVCSSVESVAREFDSEGWVIGVQRRNEQRKRSHRKAAGCAPRPLATYPAQGHATKCFGHADFQASVVVLRCCSGTGICISDRGTTLGSCGVTDCPDCLSNLSELPPSRRAAWIKLLPVCDRRKFFCGIRHLVLVSDGLHRPLLEMPVAFQRILYGAAWRAT